jgi:hypothetical protein
LLYRTVAAFAAGVSASMLVLGCGIARADESAYIKLLDVHGVPYETPTGAMLMGEAVCSSLENGTSVEHMKYSLMVGGRSGGGADWPKDQADWLISAAALDLCPQDQGVLKAYGPPFFVSP